MMKSGQWTILLDLDQTLILTSALADLRRQKLWPRVYNSFHLTSLPEHTKTFLQEAQELAPLGVVTTSPRPYAEKILTYHGCQVPVVVAYHDTPRQKPFPDSILLAAKKLQVSSTKCFYIGDSLNDITAATNANAIPIGLCWDGLLQRETVPSTCTVCGSWNEVLTIIKRIMLNEKVPSGL